MHFPAATILLALAASAHASPSFVADLSPENGSQLEERQIAAGGGVPATALAPSQYPIVSVVGSLFTIGGATSVTWTPFTQTFAATALGSWDLGLTPRPGSIGLGDITGQVGATVSKRAIETAAPKI